MVLSQDLALEETSLHHPGTPIFCCDAYNKKMLTEIRLTNTSLTLGSVGKGGGELDFSARGLAFAGL